MIPVIPQSPAWELDFRRLLNDIFQGRAHFCTCVNKTVKPMLVFRVLRVRLKLNASAINQRCAGVFVWHERHVIPVDKRRNFLSLRINSMIARNI